MTATHEQHLSTAAARLHLAFAGVVQVSECGPGQGRSARITAR
jgi:hypothetical protein